MWGYWYVMVLVVWRKLKKDGTTQGRAMGSWTRTNCEYMLMGIIGKVWQFRGNRRHIINI